MKNPPAIRQYMSLTPKTIEHDQTLESAADYMRKLHVRHLPVMKAGKFAGILSSRDLNLAIAMGGLKALKLRAGFAMTEEPCTVDLGTSLAEVAKVMLENSCGGVLVTNRGKPVGIFTEVDALKALADFFAEPSHDK